MAAWRCWQMHPGSAAARPTPTVGSNCGAYDALVEVGGRYRLPGVRTWATRLEAEASALGMRPFSQRARQLVTSLQAGHGRPRNP